MTRDDDGLRDRAAGALMGAFIGEALGVGPHWFYDLAEQRRHYGAWIDGYTRPLPGRYHEGLEPGDLSQAGLILKLTLCSLVEKGRYDQADWCARFERLIFERIDGTPTQGPGGYTSQSVREAFARWRANGGDWNGLAGPADTTEALERTLAMGAFLALDPKTMVEAVARNTLLTQNDGTVVVMTVAFNTVIALLVQGEPFDAAISGKLVALAKSGVLPFHTITGPNDAPPGGDHAERAGAHIFPSPDALLTPSLRDARRS